MKKEQFQTILTLQTNIMNDWSMMEVKWLKIKKHSFKENNSHCFDGLTVTVTD